MSEEVKKMFSSIAHRYDLLNSILSMGIHHQWKKKTVNWSGASEGMSILDCASGTGDLAFAFKKAAGPLGEVVATDFCSEMLQVARNKKENNKHKIIWEEADVMNLPYDDDRFDICSIAFGIRNVSDPLKAIAEMARVVKPGGYVMVLEFGQPCGLFKYPYAFYSRHIIPRLGGWISGNKQAYEYLPETSAAFPSGERFLSMMQRTGQFESVYDKALLYGVAFIYKGVVGISKKNNTSVKKE